ncbi:hypothetical protein FZC66_14180 [Priestia megaterium]|nr:hypothetical protein FZC66_14180 [Priestia megaterium]
MLGLLLYLLLAGFTCYFLMLWVRTISLKIKIRRLIKGHPKTIGFLRRRVFNRHELIKSLKGKVMDELSNNEILIDKNRLSKIIDKEIYNVLRGWKIILPFLSIMVVILGLIVIGVSF